jgi:hypothetical protein
VRNPVLSTVLALCLSAGCASSEWHWTDPGVHVVAGAWLKDEVTCEMDAADTCGLALRAAREWVHADGRAAVVSGRWAQIPRHWADATGREHHIMLAGLFAPSVAILLLESGDVRLVALMCGPDLTHGKGDIAVCSPQGDVWAQNLVGAPRPDDRVF